MTRRRTKRDVDATPADVATPPELRLEWWPIGNVKPYGRNAKKHPPEQVALVAQSIAENGWGAPLVVRADGELVAGHCRLAAAQSLSLERVPVVIREDLTAEQAQALRITDNRLSELGSWDRTMLAGEIQALRELEIDVSGLGFSDDELGKLERELAAELAGVEREDAGGSGAAPAPRGTGAPVISYPLIFEDDAQQALWHDFLRTLKRTYPADATVAARLVRWIQATSAAEAS